jgi:uncharacterized protein (DUF885 family)
MENTLTRFHQILDDHWEAWLRHDPLFATYAGDHRYDHLLPGADETWYLEWLESLRGYATRLKHLDRLDLSEADQLNFDIFARHLDLEIRELELRGYHLPVSKAGGFHTSMPDLYLMMPMASLQDYENYIARLEGCDKYFLQSIALLRAGLQQGFLPSRPTLVGMEDSINAQIVSDATASPFFQPFKEFPATLNGAERDRLSKAGAEAVRSSVIPAYQKFLRFFNEEYLPSARPGIAAGELPDGCVFYEHRIAYFTTLSISPEQVHQTGLSEVARIRQEMQQVIQQVGFVGGMDEFLKFLRSDPRFYVTEPAALLKETAYVLKRMDGELPRLFKTLPRLPYGIRPIPDFSAPGNTAAYYFPGMSDGTRAGTYYVNTYDLPSRPLYEIEALSLHEAVPGHHLQIAMQQELAGLPNFRRHVFFTSYVEGWALYAERLGLEVGFYSDPYSNFGRLSYEMWRACRLVVDTGMHALGWSRQQAIDFMAENTSSTMLNIVNEIDRYIAWPGQALAYKTGELKIRQLRQQAETALGGRFDLREFHDLILLSGSIPLDILENRVNAWIDQVKS